MRDFDPARMRLNAMGRAVWTHPPEGERRGGFPRGGINPASLPTAWETSPEPAEPEPAEPSPPARETPREPPDTTPAEPRSAPAPAPQVAGVEAGLGGVPLPQVPDGPAPGDDPPEQMQGEAEGTQPADPAELPADRSTAPVLPDGAPGLPPAAWSEDEMNGWVTMHEWVINSYAAAFPRKYTPTERDDVGRAVRGVLNRYGGGLSEHAPLVSFAVVTGAIALQRAHNGCEGCGEPNPAQALYCMSCGDAVGSSPGGPCINGPCPVELPQGTKFCPGCGTRQLPGEVPPGAPPAEQVH
ncbi:MAG: hypothetical protein SangKO_031960 [Sandaracinaceae bacterium]